MTVSASQLLPWIVLLPLLGAIVNGLFGKRFPRRLVYGIGVGSVAIAFVMAVRAFYALRLVAAEDPLSPALKTVAWTWLNTGLFQFDVAFYLDPLSAVMLLIVTGVGLLIHIYSTGYMSEDPGVHRYFAYLNLFMFSMLVLILGKNLLMLFVGWEGVGLCSYLLIGFWFTDDQKAQAGQKAFVVNRVGDFGFLIGMLLLLFYAGGTTDYEVLAWNFEYLDRRPYGPFPDYMTLTVACLLLFVGACGKSAQIPLYVWLPDAMAGPTPVSALIHAATMVTAGVYMMARLSFMYTLSPLAMGVIATIGALTAVAAAMMALTQRDIKKVLAYSTVSQLGYMVLAVGVGAFMAGVFHLMTHAFFKALLFLGAGSVIHGLMGEQDIFKMGGLRRKMPATHVTFLIATLAIAGVPFLSGFYSKDAILWETLTRKQQLQIPEAASASFSDGETQWIGGSRGVVLRGEGADWETTRVPPTLAGVRGVEQAVHPRMQALTRDPSGALWAVSDYTTIYRYDGEWELMHQPPDRKEPSLRGVWAAAPDDVWFVGDFGLAIHYDGQQFNLTDTGTAGRLRAVAGKSPTEVYAAGVGGTIIKWDGQTWQAVPSTGTAGITDLRMVGDTLWATTELGDLLTLGGSGWQKVAIEAPGVARIRKLEAIGTGTPSLTLAGQAVLQGDETPRSVVLTRLPDDSFAVSASDSGATLATVFGGPDVIYAATTDRRLLRANGGDGTLEAVGGVPHKPWFHKLLWVLGCLAAGMTAFYMFRLYFMTFTGETRCDEHTWKHAHESPPNMTGPLIILGVLSVIGGWFSESLFEWLEPTFRIAKERLEFVHHGLLAYTPTVVGAAGIFLAWFWYGRRSETPSKLASQYTSIYKVLYNKFYVDELYDLIIVRPFRRTAWVLHKIVDVIFIDTVLVRGSALVAATVGRAVRVVQTGNVQQYAVAIAVGLAALFWFVGV